jgi:hypothetical protein
MTDPLPRTADGWSLEVLRRIWSGDVEELELFAVLDDPNSDFSSRWHALTGLGTVSGDDARAAAAIRMTMSDPALQDMEGFQMGVESLVARAHTDARDDLEVALRSRYSTVRSAALNGLAYIGDASHYEEMFPLFNRAVTRGQRSSGGFRVDDLAIYLLSCVKTGMGNFDEIKALIRANWSKIPSSPGDDVRGFLDKLLPQIGADATDISTIGPPTLEFPKYQRR